MFFWNGSLFDVWIFYNLHKAAVRSYLLEDCELEVNFQKKLMVNVAFAGNWQLLKLILPHG